MSNATLSINVSTIVFPRDHSSNLPIVSTEANVTKYVKVCDLHHGSQPEEEDNLTTNQRQLLRWHRIIGQIGFHTTQSMTRAGVLPENISNFPIHVCGSCQIGK